MLNEIETNCAYKLQHRTSNKIKPGTNVNINTAKESKKTYESDVETDEHGHTHVLQSMKLRIEFVSCVGRN